MNPHPLIIAACAPASYGFVPDEAVAVTERVIKGRETNPRRIREHVDRMLDHHLRILRRAGRRKANVAVIPEDSLRLSMIISRHRRERFCSRAIEEAYERYTARIGEVCREFEMYVVGGTMTRREGRFYNTAVMQDPRGRVIATYDKTHLPRNGEHRSLAPGMDLPVFSTPIGRVGFLICWDILFPEAFAVLALKGAEIIFQPTFGHAGEASDILVRSRASDWSVPVVVSMWGGSACIADANGALVAHTGPKPDSIAVARVRVGAPRRLQYLRDAHRDKLKERRRDLYGILTRK